MQLRQVVGGVGGKAWAWEVTLGYLVGRDAFYEYRSRDLHHRRRPPAIRREIIATGVRRGVMVSPGEEHACSICSATQALHAGDEHV